jgi:hypothetical protein
MDFHELKNGWENGLHTIDYIQAGLKANRKPACILFAPSSPPTAFQA